MRLKKEFVSLVCFLFFIPITVVSYGAEPNTPVIYEKMPVREITVFKDGHAYIVHEGQLKTNADNNVVLDGLPAPVMGTFWAYSTASEAALSSVVASRDNVPVSRPAGSIEDMLRANYGKQIILLENGQKEYEALIIRILESPAETPPRPQPDSQKLVLLKVNEGFKTIPIGHIQQLTFVDKPSEKVNKKEQKDTLTLNLKWASGEKHDTAGVGMAYVQKGIRWIPNYRVDIDGNGKAAIQLQATLINELQDLQDVKAYLVIGVPRFAFQDTPDPISFQEAMAQLSGQFRPDNRTAYAFSNAVMTQVKMDMDDEFSERRQPQINPGPEVSQSDKNEDLFIFTIDHITLRKGQRMVFPIAQYTLPYKDVYVLNIPYAPPMQVRQNMNSQQQMELAKLFNAPKAMHKLRLTNQADYPLTTAPALLFRQGKLLAQSMMTYTGIGGQTDLEMTTAVDIGVKYSDAQTNLTPNAIQWNGSSYAKIEMAGTIELSSYKNTDIQMEVVRSVLGNTTSATMDGKITQSGHFGDGMVIDSTPYWWNWCNWPWWWYHVNSVGKIDWTIDLKAGETKTLDYQWHYFWR